MGIFSTVFDIHQAKKINLLLHLRPAFGGTRLSMNFPKQSFQSKIASGEATSEIQKTSEFFSRFLC